MNDEDKAAEIKRRFQLHLPGSTTAAMHEDMRFRFGDLAAGVGHNGGSRETSLALTALEEALMWANAHIARNLDPETGAAL